MREVQLPNFIVLINILCYFINLRIWNLDDTKSAKESNKAVFEKVNEFRNIYTQLKIEFNLSEIDVEIKDLILILADE